MRGCCCHCARASRITFVYTNSPVLESPITTDSYNINHPKPPLNNSSAENKPRPRILLRTVTALTAYEFHLHQAMSMHPCTFLRSTEPMEKVKRLISHLFASVSQFTTASMLNCAGAATRVRPSVVGLYFAPAVGTKQTRYSTTCDHNRRCNVNVKQT
jgi:hypothetical protein